MAVHGKYKQPCPVCGSPVQRIVYAANEANYCPTCQTEGRLLADRALSRLLGEDWPRSLEELEELKSAHAGSDITGGRERRSDPACSAGQRSPALRLCGAGQGLRRHGRRLRFREQGGEDHRVRGGQGAFDAGRFVWVDIEASDPSEARRLLSALEIIDEETIDDALGTSRRPATPATISTFTSCSPVAANATSSSISSAST